MKSVFLVVLLAAAATAAVVSNEVPDVADVDVNEMPEMVVPEVVVLADADERLAQTGVTIQRQQSWGTIGSSDRLVYNNTHSAGPVNGFHRDIRISVGSRISAIRAAPVGTSQNVRLSIKSGGVGSNNVTFRVHTPWGRGYNVTIRIYGGSALI